MTRILILTIFVFQLLAASATHIVGGDVNYEYLKDNEYKITLNIYIDCVNGTVGAINSDRKAIISYFNAETNTLIEYDELDLLSEEDVAEVHYKCLKVEPNACVKQFSFSYIKELDPGNDGIVITFQRCCRNRTISNLVDPMDIGATFWTEIPSNETVINNSSAVFQKLPPNFLCTDAPLVFDHHAVDKDGDSLVYSLILPYEGANPDKPRPIPASNPPYNSVPMKSGYGVTNMMNGTVKLQINPITGELRITPSEVGQFVMAIRVEEYRNGIKINEGFRDYQLNVIDCSFDVIANFNCPERSCDKTIEFENLSLGQALRYRWDFGDPSTEEDKSSAKDEVYTYPISGSYRIKLVVFNDGCSDTFYRDVQIYDKDSIFSRFEIDPSEGCDSLLVFIENNSDDSEHFKWDMGDGTSFNWDENVEQYFYNSPGKYRVSLVLEDSNACNITNSSFKDVTIMESRKVNASFTVDYKTDCAANGKVHIISDNNAEFYTWTLGDGTEIVNEDISLHKYNESGGYTITLTTSDTGLCVSNDTFHMNVEMDDPSSILEGVTLYNVFTPDEDDYNQCFSIDIKKAQCVDLTYRIYNRWGELVYIGNGLNDCWKGINSKSGEDAPAGEYFGIYCFTTNHNGKVVEMSNVITLLRN
jgi:gliding motility-associated-like protein